MSLTPTRRVNLAEQVIEQLRSEIIGGRWPCGTRLPTEDDLSNSLGVGRNTVREAVRALVHAGLLEVRQGAGTFVRSNRDVVALVQRFDHATLRDQLEVRRALEVEAARLAAVRRTDEDLALIHDALTARGGWADDASLEAFVDRDARFHFNIVRASHNASLIEMYRYFWSGLRNTIASTEKHPLPEPSYAAHEAVYNAILKGSPTESATAVNDMLSPALAALEQLANDHKG